MASTAAAEEVSLAGECAAAAAVVVVVAVRRRATGAGAARVGGRRRRAEASVAAVARGGGGFGNANGAAQYYYYYAVAVAASQAWERPAAGVWRDGPGSGTTLAEDLLRAVRDDRARPGYRGTSGGLVTDTRLSVPSLSDTSSERPVRA